MNVPMKHAALVATALILLTSMAPLVKGQAATGTVNDGVYTEAQAVRGKTAYTSQCQTCHGESMSGIDTAPPLSGGTFLSNWTGQTVGDLAARIRTTMPLNNPGTLSSATVADIIACILKVNGYPAGAAELPREVQVQQAIRIDAPKSH
jgi:quinoprotein glucose dehydrogenase